MKCPFCGAWSDVLETRDGRRRRQCANGHRFTTEEAVTSYTARRVRDRNRQAAKRVLAGEPQTKVAESFGMPRTELSRYMRREHPDYNSRTAGQLARWRAVRG